VDHAKKQAVVYILDGSAGKAPDVAADKITDVKLTLGNAQPPVTIDLKHDATKSDAKGIAFVGTHDALGKEMEFKGTVNGKVNGKDYAGEFAEKADGHKHEGAEKHSHHEDGLGGVTVAIHQGRYYAEALLEKGGVLNLFLFNSDASRVVDVEVQTLTAYVKPVGAEEFTPVELKPLPQFGDARGFTSQFSGDLPGELRGKPLEVAILNIKVGGERYRLAFQTGTHGAGTVAHGGGAMPPKVEDDAERKLYLTPAGRYTEADIKANGNLTASVKFANFQAAHDINPKTGDRICPVTLTKANPQCTWVVDGKTYQFCCPPCVDEFVRMAKESPDQIKPPEMYVKK